MIYLSSPIVLPTPALPTWVGVAFGFLAGVWAGLGIAILISRKQYRQAMVFFLLAVALFAPLVAAWWPGW